MPCTLCSGVCSDLIADTPHGRSRRGRRWRAPTATTGAKTITLLRSRGLLVEAIAQVPGQMPHAVEKVKASDQVKPNSTSMPERRRGQRHEGLIAAFRPVGDRDQPPGQDQRPRPTGHAGDAVGDGGHHRDRPAIDGEMGGKRACWPPAGICGPFDGRLSAIKCLPETNENRTGPEFRGGGPPVNRTCRRACYRIRPHLVANLARAGANHCSFARWFRRALQPVAGIRHLNAWPSPS